MTYHQYLGLPAQLQADPRDGKAADCLLLAFAILDDLGKPHPAPEAAWFDAVTAGRWWELEALWRRYTRPLNGPCTGAVTLLESKRSTGHRLGVGTVVDDHLVMVHPRKGVVAAPVEAFPSFTYREFIA